MEAVTYEAPSDRLNVDADVLAAMTFDGLTDSRGNSGGNGGTNGGTNGGRINAHMLGFVHKHGAWMGWSGPPAAPDR